MFSHEIDQRAVGGAGKAKDHPVSRYNANNSMMIQILCEMCLSIVSTNQ